MHKLKKIINTWYDSTAKIIKNSLKATVCLVLCLFAAAAATALHAYFTPSDWFMLTVAREAFICGLRCLFAGLLTCAIGDHLIRYKMPAE